MSFNVVPYVHPPRIKETSVKSLKATFAVVTHFLLEAGLRICVTLLRIRIQLFYFSADPDPNSDPAPHQNDANLLPLVYIPPGLHFLLLRLHGPPLLHFEPLKLLNFDFKVDPTPNPAFH
jgi:hypothetical protein